VSNILCRLQVDDEFNRKKFAVMAIGIPKEAT
jgi:hypothetical protein